MTLSNPEILGIIYGVSEFVLAMLRRSTNGATSKDRGSLRLLWIVILTSVTLGFGCERWLSKASLPCRPLLYTAGLSLFAAGLLLRWYSIIHLGKLFTVNVSIAVDHSVIDSGPYRYIRHPSYLGALLAFLGLGLSLGNAASLLIIIAPITLAFLYRMRIEEAALVDALGKDYRAYMRRTKRLLPALY